MSSLTIGERICAANRYGFQDLARLADGSRYDVVFTVNEVEAVYQLYKKLSNSIIKDGLNRPWKNIVDTDMVVIFY
uniref:Uncharacterized protein n=1 Tax=Populus trichocarpa TaxID=3694 RepID=A0A2K2AJ89_POPTR